MKKQLFVLLILSCLTIRAQFVGFTDNATHNRFLGLDIPSCATTAHDSKRYFKAYACGNNSVSDLLNLNILNPGLLGKQFYVYNDFMYWIGNRYAMGKWNGKDAQAAKQFARATASPDKYFSGSGVFLIVLGTSPYLQQIVAPNKTCPAGQTLVVAQLKYNDGNSIACWSQDAVCMSPKNTFNIDISRDQDNSVPTFTGAEEGPDKQGVNWMKDRGPSANYLEAGNSPRKIRLVVK